MSRPAIPKDEQQVEQLRVLASIQRDPAKLIALLAEINSLARQEEERMRPLPRGPLRKTA